MVNCTTRFYAYISNAWTLLNDSGAAGSVSGSWGMSGNSPLDRVADAGELRVTLNNSGGLYTPGGPNALAGFVKGIPIKMVCAYEGTDTEWYYYLKDIDIKAGIKDKRAYINCITWLDYAQKHPIENPGIESNQTGDQVLDTAIALASVQPQGTDFDTGIETFPTAFDTTTSHTTIYSEMGKVAFSELGYVYEKKNGTIVFESADARPGSRTVDQIPIDNASSGFMQKEDEDYLLLETGDKIVLNQTGATSLTSSTITDFDAPYGEHVINKMTVWAYPRRLDATPQVLFGLDKEIKIASGRSYTLKGTYANPDGGLPINAQDMLTPVATTDYTMFTATSGGGSNITADLSVSITYGTEGFTAVLTNNNAAKGFVNFFQTRGTGIYLPNPISHEANNAVSIAAYETESETLHQKYKNDIDAGRVFVDSQVEQFKDPRAVLNSITFIANKSSGCMMAWLYGEVGQVHYIDIDELGLTGNYYIQGIEFQMNGKIIRVTWIVAATLSLLTGCGLTPLAVDFPGRLSPDAVEYPYDPRISDLSLRSYSAWVYALDPGVETGAYYIAAADSNARGWWLAFRQSALILQYGQCGTSDVGIWETPDALTRNAWVHVVVTRDVSSSSNAPVMYIDGTSQVVTETNPQTTATSDEEGLTLVIGNQNNLAANYSNPFSGKIFDFRIYNRILTQAEVTTLYNSGNPSASVGSTNGLVFQAFAVRSGETANYVDQTLTSTTNLFDAQFKAVGTVHGVPVGRAAP